MIKISSLFLLLSFSGIGWAEQLLVKIPKAPFYAFRPLELSRFELINGLISQAEEKRWLQLIKELVENEDLETPGKFYKSRYSRRVRKAIQRDGKPLPDGACDNAADYIAQKFKSYGYEVEFDLFQHNVFGEGEYWMRNVVATLPGKGPNRDRLYLITAHYDSIASKNQGWLFNWRTILTPGANDNASGTAEILEIARIISGQNFDFTIKFIAFSGEELGLYGSKHYAQKNEKEQIAGVLNFDQLGYDLDNLDIHVLGDANSEWLVNAFSAVSKKYGIKVDLRKAIDPEFVFSDHAPFWSRGYAAVHISEDSSLKSPDFYPFGHSTDDTIDKLNPALGKEAIKLGVATISELANLMPQSPEASNFSPDFIVEPDSLKFSSSTPSKNDLVKVFMRLKNLGLEDEKDENVKYKILAIAPSGQGETLIEAKARLKAGKPVEIAASIRLKEWGLYKIRAVVNPDYDIFESRFDNNIVEKPLTVSSGTLRIDGIVIYPNPARIARISDGSDSDVDNISHNNISSDKPQVKIQYFLSKDADVKLEIFSVSGEEVYNKEYMRGAQGGRFGPNGKKGEIFWTGENLQGGQVAPGIYICRLLATDESGNRGVGYGKIAVLR